MVTIKELHPENEKLMYLNLETIIFIPFKIAVYLAVPLLYTSLYFDIFLATETI